MSKKSKKTTQKSLPKTEVIPARKTKIKVIGIGGGASNIVSEIASKIKKATFVVANTDSQALRVANRKAQRFQFGQNITRGLGTGMVVEKGELAAQQDREKIKKILEGQDLSIIIACLGGGTSSGAAPIFSQISKNLGNITLGIFTLPFSFEGEKKMEIAKIALQKLKPKLNSLIIIPNERVFQIIDKKTPLKTALSIINKNLAEGLQGLIETIYQPGLINIDFADLKTVLDGQGRLSYLNSIKVLKKDEGVSELIEKVLHNPLYPYTIRGAKGVLLNISGEKDLELSEVNQISKTISELVNKEAKIIFGISQNRKYSNNIQISLLATGCGLKIFSKETKKKQKKQKKQKKVIEKNIPAKPSIPKSENRIVKKKKKRKPIEKPVEKIKKPMKKPMKKNSKEQIKKIPVSNIKTEENKEDTLNLNQVKVPKRKNALEIAAEAKAAEEEMLEKEKIWESPAFLRRQVKKDE